MAGKEPGRIGKWVGGIAGPRGRRGNGGGHGGEIAIGAPSTRRDETGPRVEFAPQPD